MRTFSLPSPRLPLSLFLCGAAMMLRALLATLYVQTTFAVCSEPCVLGSEEIMKQKSHGTSETAVQENLRWGCDYETSDRICNFNRHYAEHRGYFLETSFLDEESEELGVKKFYDSNTGKLLFIAPHERTWEEFIRESKNHGWPSFRDEEVNWEYVRILPSGEAVSVDGTHLGHNLPDRKGNRYCINLVSIAGQPQDQSEEL